MWWGCKTREIKMVPAFIKFMFYQKNQKITIKYSFENKHLNNCMKKRNKLRLSMSN